MASTERIKITVAKKKKPARAPAVKAQKKVVAKVVSKKASTPLADLMAFDKKRRNTMTGWK